MRNAVLCMLLLCGCALSALSADQTWTQQIRMQSQPVDDAHVTTKEYVDGADASIGERIDGAYEELANTVRHEDLADYVTEAELGADMALKADLVGGYVPMAQLPPGISPPRLFRIVTEGELVTLTEAVVNDEAVVTGADPKSIFKLTALPPTDFANWTDISGTGNVVSVNGKTDAVFVDLYDFPLVQNEFADYARAESLVQYAKLDGAALTGTTVATPPAAAGGSQVVNAEWTRSLLTGSLAAAAAVTIGTEAPLVGGGSIGANRTLAIAPAGAATATTAGAEGSAVYAPDNAAATVRDQAVTPAGWQAAWNARVLWGTGDPPAGTYPRGTLYLKTE